VREGRGLRAGDQGLFVSFDPLPGPGPGAGGLPAAPRGLAWAWYELAAVSAYEGRLSPREVKGGEGEGEG